jgi:hypothetical protein
MEAASLAFFGRFSQSVMESIGGQTMFLFKTAKEKKTAARRDNDDRAGQSTLTTNRCSTTATGKI